MIYQCFIKEKGGGTLGKIPTSENETFYKVNNHYPLEKYTTGFFGKKVFSLPPKKKPHVVFIYLESFRSSDVGKITPHFDKWAKKGIFFSHFYASATQTFKAMFATFYGLPPCFGKDFTESSSPVLTLPLKGLPNFFKEKGYTNLFIKAGSHHFDRQGEFLQNHHFDEIYDEKDVKQQNPEAFGTSWGVHDEFMYDFLIKKIQDAQSPLFISTASITNHHPFVTPENFIPFFGKTPFEKAMEYSDHALGLTIEKLSDLHVPIHLFIMGDHGYPKEHADRPSLSLSLDTSVTHIPLLILPLHCGTFAPQEITDVASQIDLLPTLMDLYTFVGKNSAIGSSLVRKRNNPTAYLLNESLEPLSGIVSKDRYEIFEGYLPFYNTLKHLYSVKKISSEDSLLKTLNLSNLMIPPNDLEILLNTHLSLENLYLDNAPLIASLDFSYPKGIKKITLENNILLSDEDIPFLPKTITSVSLLGCKNLTDKSLNYLKTLPLKEISLSCKDFSKAGLFHFFSSLSLDKVYLTEAQHLDSSFFDAFSSHRLCEIILHGSPILTDSSLKSITSPFLKTFMSDNCSLLSDEGLSHFKKCPLEILHLGKAEEISDKGIDHLQDVRLHTFFISHSPYITEGGIEKMNTPFIRNIFCVDCSKMPQIYTDTPEKQIYYLKDLSSNT